MNVPQIEFARQWLVKAEHDLVTARCVLSVLAGPTDTPCFHAQQAVEKALKAILCAHGVAFAKVHDLLPLLDAVLPIMPEFSSHRELCAQLSAYAVEMRYPGLSFDPPRDEAVHAADAATSIVAAVAVHVASLAP